MTKTCGNCKWLKTANKTDLRGVCNPKRPWWAYYGHEDGFNLAKSRVSTNCKCWTKKAPSHSQPRWGHQE